MAAPRARAEPGSSRGVPAPLMLASLLCTLWLAGHMWHEARMRSLLLSELHAAQDGRGCDATQQPLWTGDDPSPEVLRLVRRASRGCGARASRQTGV